MAVSKRKLLELLEQEKNRRDTLPDMLDSCFDQQRKFITDKSRRKALFVSRRSGKSFCLGIYLIKEAIENPACKVIYLGISKFAAENVMWKHTIFELLQKNKILHKYNINTKTVSFDNGSTIKLTGGDASYQEINKYLGGKYRLIVIDEAQSWTEDLDDIINDKLGPAITDYIASGGGIICLAGTAGNHMGINYWYRVTKSEGVREPGWSVHTWEALDNPHMKENVLDEWTRWEKDYGPNFKLRNDFRQQWLCEWVVEDTERVYRFELDRNVLLERLPEGERKNPTPARSFQLKQEIEIARELKAVDNKWKYILGMDLGWEDATAWVIGAFNKNNKNFYIVESFKKNHTLISTIAAITQELLDKYNFCTMLVDAGGGGKHVAEELRRTHKLPFKGAEKQGKEAIISRMNSDFITENIKIIEASNKELIKEWNELIVDHKKKAEGIFKENEQYHNHLADAALYCFREARHYWSKPIIEEPNDLAAELMRQKKRTYMPSKDWYDLMEEQQENREVIRRFRDGD